MTQGAFELVEITGEAEGIARLEHETPCPPVSEKKKTFQHTELIKSTVRKFHILGKRSQKSFHIFYTPGAVLHYQT
jgi:hypothetical protein